MPRNGCWKCTHQTQEEEVQMSGGKRASKRGTAYIMLQRDEIIPIQ